MLGAQATFHSAVDTPMTTPATLPTCRVRDSGGVLVDSGSAVEVGEGTYFYAYTFSPQVGESYSVQMDGDPIAAGQTIPGSRYMDGSFSGDGIADSIYEGFVWYDPAGAAGDLVGTNGTRANPVDNETDALSIAASIGVEAFKVAGSLTLASAYDGWTFEASDETGAIAFGGQSVARSVFRELQCSGVLVDEGPNVLNRFVDCVIFSTSFLAGSYYRCQFALQVALTATSLQRFVQCSAWSQDPALVPNFDLTDYGIAGSIRFDQWSGPVSFENLTVVDAFVDLTGVGADVTLEASVTSGIFSFSGTGAVADSSTATSVADLFVQPTGGLTAQQTRDALKLAPTAGAPAAGSVDEHLETARDRGAHMLTPVYIDTVNGAAGTDPELNGIESNPCLTEADALTIAAALGSKYFKITNTFTATQAYDGFIFESSDENGKFAANGQDIVRCVFRGMQVSGAFAAAPADRNYYYDCVVLSVSNFAFTAQRTRFAANIAVESLFSHDMHDCSPFGANPALRPVFDFTGAAASTRLSATGWRGFCTVSNVTVAGPDIDISGVGDITLDASNTEGDFNLHGLGVLTDNTVGSAVVNRDGWVQSIDVAETYDYTVNRSELDFGVSPVQQVTYNRDGSTEKTRADLLTDGGEDVITAFGNQTKRGPEVP